MLPQCPRERRSSLGKPNPLRRGLFGGHGRAPAKTVEAAVDPQLVELFLDTVLRQAAVQCQEIDAVHLLILIEAGELDRLGAG